MNKSITFPFSKIITLILLVLFIVCNSTAKEYDGAMLWDLKGNVKNVKLDSPLMKYGAKTSFLKDGRIKNRLMSYDDLGRPIGCGMNNGDTYAYLNISYSPEGKMSRVKMRNRTYSKDEIIIEYLFTYEDDSVKSVTVFDNEVPDGKIEYFYSDYEYDDSGNWIKRKVKKIVTYPDGKTKSDDLEESRKIKYF